MGDMVVGTYLIFVDTLRKHLSMHSKCKRVINCDVTTFIVINKILSISASTRYTSTFPVIVVDHEWKVTIETLPIQYSIVSKAHT